MHQYDSYPSSIETKTDKVQSVDISDNMNAYLTTQNSVSVITKNRVQSLFDEKNMEDELNGNVQYIESRKSIYALIDEGHVSFTKNDLMGARAFAAAKKNWLDAQIISEEYDDSLSQVMTPDNMDLAIACFVYIAAGHGEKIDNKISRRRVYSMMSQRYVTKNPDQDIVDHAQYCKELHQVINKGYSGRFSSHYSVGDLDESQNVIYDDSSYNIALGYLIDPSENHVFRPKSNSEWRVQDGSHAVRDTIDYEMAVLNNLPKNKHRDFVSSRYLSKDISADVDSPNTMSRYLLSLMIALRSGTLSHDENTSYSTKLIAEIVKYRELGCIVPDSDIQSYLMGSVLSEEQILFKQGMGKGFHSNEKENLKGMRDFKKSVNSYILTNLGRNDIDVEVSQVQIEGSVEFSAVWSSGEETFIYRNPTSILRIPESVMKGIERRKNSMHLVRENDKIPKTGVYTTTDGHDLVPYGSENSTVYDSVLEGRTQLLLKSSLFEFEYSLESHQIGLQATRTQGVGVNAYYFFNDDLGVGGGYTMQHSIITSPGVLKKEIEQTIYGMIHTKKVNLFASYTAGNGLSSSLNTFQGQYDGTYGKNDQELALSASVMMAEGVVKSIESALRLGVGTEKKNATISIACSYNLDKNTSPLDISMKVNFPLGH